MGTRSRSGTDITITAGNNTQDYNDKPEQGLCLNMDQSLHGYHIRIIIIKIRYMCDVVMPLS